MRHGLVLGKFLPYHVGHAHLIRMARGQVDHLTVLVCSVKREPIPGAVRHGWVTAAHPDCRVVHVAEEVPQAPEDDPAFWPIWTDLINRNAGAVDIVFTSEDYGDELARRIDAQHVCVDRERRAFPVSGTAIRNDPLGHWVHIPAVVRPFYVRRIAILGAESTGKTTLAEALARTFETEWVPEFGRAYCEGRDPRTLLAGDFEAIGRRQAEAEDEAARRANKLLICDTDLRTTCTWSDLIIGSRPSWLAAEARRRRYHHALLLDADVPWIDDGTRVLRDQRVDHTRRLRLELEVTRQPYTILSGSFERRFAAGAHQVRHVLEVHSSSF
jgi:NadR type nicotinamide-nucleotide adenylyltransferase